MGLPWQWSTLGQHRTTDAERLRFPCLIAGQRLSFSGHEEIYRCNGSSSCHSPAHCFDESPAGYSWVGCSPAEPTCASPAESIMPNRRSIEKRNDRNAPFHPTPLTKNCKGCPGTNCKGCLGTGHDVGLLGQDVGDAAR